MKRKLTYISTNIYYFFPIQLLVHHIKSNQILLGCWGILFTIVTGNLGNYLGVPYLFLDPEYLGEVGFVSFFIMGIVIAGFTVAYHITCYIIDGHRFSFIGMFTKPFTRFSLNNSIIPLVFLATYVYCITQYQLYNKASSTAELTNCLLGLLSGYLFMTIMFFIYFWFTNKDIFKYVVHKVDAKIKQNIKVTRAGAMKKLDIARKKQTKVRHVLTLRFRLVRADEYKGYYNKATILQVFDQNHFNLVIIEVLIFIVLLLLGLFKDNPLFQLPAAASFVLFFTVFVMFSGAFSYWFGAWSITATVILILTVNLLMKNGILSNQYKAYGLDYQCNPTVYNVNHINALSQPEYMKEDKENTLKILQNWKEKLNHERQKPKMVFVCTSGGGQRSALWSLTTLQAADSLTYGRLMAHTMLMTGASGGVIGASYFRELILRRNLGGKVNPYHEKYQQDISSDNLNTIIFSLLANDMFVGFKKFEYNKMPYNKDRIYSFEEQLNKNTRFMLDKPLSAYKVAEAESIIPMMILGPTVINDGRKLFISPQQVSYMNLGNENQARYFDKKANGVDFQRLFYDHNAAQLRFLSALRMNATFPYITPTTTLPTLPRMEIMDAGIGDNFGITDAARFMYSFKDWINRHTSGVILVSIRDSQKNNPIPDNANPSLFDKFFTPIRSIYNNFEGLQDIQNDDAMEYANGWLNVKVHRVDFEYNPANKLREKPKVPNGRQSMVERASLNWRLTSKEKKGIIENINSNKNQRSLTKLRQLLGVDFVDRE